MAPDAEPDRTTEALERRLEKLEKQERSSLLLQLLSPVLVLVVGWWLNARIEENKAALERTRVEAERVDVAQRMIATMFDGNPTKAFATSRLMKQIVDEPVAAAFDSILVSYYNTKVAESVMAGNVDSAAAIIAAARSVDGSVANAIESSVGREGADSIRTYQSRTAAARAREREGFQHLAAGDFDAARLAFKASEDTYNGFRASYELYSLLQSRRERLGDPQVARQTLSEILERYGNFVPADLRPGLVARARGAT